jgi:hypothetical protein
MGIFGWLKKRKEQEEQEKLRSNVEKVTSGIRALKEIKKNFSSEEEFREESSKYEDSQGKEILIIMNELFGAKFGLGLKVSDLPIILSTENLDSPAKFSLEKSTKTPMISIKMVKEDRSTLISGDSIAEEYGHFLRHKFRPSDIEDKERITGEFFGFLGRRMFFSVLDEEERKAFFPNRLRRPNTTETNSQLKSIRKTYQDAKNAVEEKEGEIIASGDKNRQHKFNKFLDETMYPKMESLEKSRADILIHERGYNFASRVDMSKIHDWKKLFSMPNHEVRMRFFRSDPDYSGL